MEGFASMGDLQVGIAIGIAIGIGTSLLVYCAHLKYDCLLHVEGIGMLIIIILGEGKVNKKQHLNPSVWHLLIYLRQVHKSYLPTRSRKEKKRSQQCYLRLSCLKS